MNTQKQKDLIPDRIAKLVNDAEEFAEQADSKTSMEYQIAGDGIVHHDALLDRLARECAKLDPEEEKNIAEGRYEY